MSKKNENLLSEENFKSEEKLNPSDTIVLKSLDYGYSESDIEAALVYYGARFDHVKLIRDRNTGASRGFAFVKFPKIELAEDFIEQNFPEIYMGNRIVRINYSKDNSFHSAEDWKCDHCGEINYKFRHNCYKCHSSKFDHSQTVVNEGNFDISESPSCNILVQGLDALTSEESLYDKFYPFGAHKVFLLRDRFTRSSLGFGFVLFHDVSTSSMTIQVCQSDPDFAIDGKKCLLNYARDGSFSFPERSKSRDEKYEDIIYWDSNAIASLYPQVEEFLDVGVEKTSDDDLNDFYADLEDVIQSKESPSETSSTSITQENTESVQSIEDEIQTKTDIYRKDINHGKNSAEQSQILEVDRTESLSPHLTTEEPPSHDDVADLTIPACLLCQRKFNSVKDLRKHQSISSLHKENFDEHLERWRKSFRSETTDLAPKKIDKKDLFTRNYLTLEEAQQLYDTRKTKNGKRKLDNAIESSSLKSSVGVKLLAKMGWKEGEGLGKEGQGVKRAIEGVSYSKGVGLGAGKSRSTLQISKKARNMYKK